ncbi:MAG: hypothetical protein J0G96_14495 [Flavobacteriia bacterium]|nr:hypothetical protein [Flavobacteriia bacterium]OJX38975.1 MAG: hypothetical protein BGO87_03020 [Flavobacteriia bacterium 40-80]
MASKRLIKKNLNSMIIEVLEESFDVQFLDESKKEKTNALINEAVDYRNSVIEKIHAAKTKKDFAPIVKDLDDKVDYFINKLNEL